MNLTKLSDKIMKNPINLAIFFIFVAIAAIVIFNSISFEKIPEITPEKKMLRYAVEHDCKRTKLNGVTWWQCQEGWWEEIELFDLANGKYHVDRSEPISKAKPTGESNETASTS